MAKDWDAAQKAARKILGPDADIPEWPPAALKAVKKAQDAWAEFQAVRQRLKDVLDDDVKETDGNFRAAWEAAEDDVKKETFGLDAKKDKDKIAAARKEFLEAVKEELQDAQKNDDGIKKLDAAMKIIMDAT